MENLIEYLKGLPWRDWAAPIITGVLALLGVFYVQHEKNMSAKEQRKTEAAKVKRDEEQRYASNNQSMVVAQTQDLTERLKALMDGYESRIEDLHAELVATKAELKAHQGICRKCPEYPERSKNAP